MLTYPVPFGGEYSATTVPRRQQTLHPFVLSQTAVTMRPAFRPVKEDKVLSILTTSLEWARNCRLLAPVCGKASTDFRELACLEPKFGLLAGRRPDRMLPLRHATILGNSPSHRYGSTGLGETAIGYNLGAQAVAMGSGPRRSARTVRLRGAAQERR